ncbi:MAG: DUF4251 domain-containing protein [Bacteroidales bacterium]|nr:DUF4251 domain-containing protein [Bacteroidales bacterium]
MKTLHVILFTFVLCIMASCGLMKDTSNPNAVADIDNFKGSVQMMHPRTYNPQNVSFGYSLELRHDTAKVYLPYIGEVYNPSFNNDGLNFDAICQDKKVTKTKKGDGKEVHFIVHHDNIAYKFKLTAFNGGMFTLDVQPDNAQGCNYTGRWDE